MPFLPLRSAALAVFGLLILGGANFFAPAALAASAAQNAGSKPQNEQEGWQPPTRMPPQRAPQTPPAALRSSILEALVKVEEESQRKAEAEARKEAERRERNEKAEQLKEQQEAREDARILREERQARAKRIAEAVKIAMPPPVAVVPAKADWPLPKFVEDPAWNTPDLALIYNSVYTQSDITTLYRPLLKAAVGGNPRAMMVLSYAYTRWGSGISSSFSVLHPPMHNGNYWRRLALQLTSPDWVELRFGDLSLDAAEKITHYKHASVYRNGEALYKLAMLEDRPELLVEAALAGEPNAASSVAFNLGMGSNGFPASPRLAAFYWWRGALAGDARALLVCSEYFYQGQGGFPKDERRAYLFALLALRASQQKGGQGDYYGPAADIMPTAARHLTGLTAALGLSEDDTWPYRQELQIFMAAPEEAKLQMLEAAAPQREAALAAMQEELFAVREVLAESRADISEQQILAKLEQARTQGEMEQARRARMQADSQRQSDNRFFVWMGLGAAALVLGSYLAMRLRLYAWVVRLVSVQNGERA